MTSNSLSDTERGLRLVVALGAVVTALVVTPAAVAGVQIGVSMHIDLPPGVHVTVGNYEPYYVGRVFYEPLSVWRPVYSFPVETPSGVVYEPFVYEGRQVVCRDYIPGPEAGYGRFIVEGRGHYQPKWYRGRAEHQHGGHRRGDHHDGDHGHGEGHEHGD